MRKKIILAISLSLLIVALCTAILILGRNIVKQGGENTTSKNEDNKEVITIHGEDGITPHIGENGNWWLGSYDTGVRAEGIDGKDGTNGKDGKNGLDGINGKDGVDGIDGITPHIGENGNWYFCNADTGIRAEGTNGKDGINGTDGVDGKDGADGINGKDGADGKDGTNGITPHIGENGNWWFGEDDTGILAVGMNGNDGATPVIKNGTWWIGGVDTGSVAIGKDGKDGATPYISGNTWWIDGEDTGIVAKGQDGNDGENGNGIVDIKIEEGILYLMFSETEGTWTEIGKIVAEVTSPTEENALDYYLLPDGTYGVTAGKQLYFDTITIPEKHLDKTVSTILPEAFSGAANLNKIEIPSSVTEIGENAFLNCKKLDKIVISESVAKIGKNAFLGCEILTICAVASSAPGGWDSDYNPDGCPVIWNCDSEIKTSSEGLRYKITDENEIIILGYEGDSYNIVIPEAIEDLSVIAIADEAFYGNTDILSVTVPSTVVNIGSGAFDGCFRLIEVYNLTDMNMTLGDIGFGSIAKYAKAIHTSNSEESILEEDNEGFVFAYSESNYNLVHYKGEESNIVLPDSYKGNAYNVGDYALYGMSDAESITIPANILAIGKYAFAECGKVTALYFEATDVLMLTEESCAFLGLGKNTEGVSVIIGAEVKYLPAYVFATDTSNSADAPKIKTVSFESGGICNNIGTKAFLNACYLESIIIPNTVSLIEANAFSGCSSLAFAKMSGVFDTGSTIIEFSVDSEINAIYLGETYVNSKLSRIA